MTKALTLGVGLAVGSGLMFLLDPDRGRRRRALLRDKLGSIARKTARSAQGKARDLRNRAQGVVAELQSHASSEPVDDNILIDRVR